MGTTLTGTTPQDTYDSLIKVTDNGPISATAKYLSDGLGNDSALALSTSKVGIATNTPAVELHVETSGTGTTSVSNVITTFRSKASGRDINIQFSDGTNQSYIGSLSGAFYVATGGSTERMRITSAGNVGIGTSTPSSPLTVYKATSPDVDIQNSSALHRITGDAGSLLIRADYGNTAANTHIEFNLDGTEVARFTPAGLTFNGDTAAANALDDYEEGTFTPTITPATSGTITPNATFTTWTYTKIGRQVTINGVFVISSVASPVGANVVVGGLPFTILNNNGAYGAFSVAYFTSATSVNSAVAGRHSINTTQLTLGVNASTVAASDEIYVTATYFV